MAQMSLNPDLTCREDGPYWAASLVLALRAGDKGRAATARRHLRRLGFRIDIGELRSPARRGGRS